MEQRQPAHQRQIVGDPLAEADARIDDDPRGVDPRRTARRDAVGEHVVDVEQDVVIAGALVRVALRRGRVHQHHRAAGARDDLHRAVVVAQRRNIVDDAGTRGERRLHHRGLARVDRYRDTALRQRGDDALDAPDLVAFPDERRAWARRFAADVDDRGACRRHGETGIGRGGGIDMLAAVGKAVGGDVEDADDLRLVQPHRAFAERQHGAGPTGGGALRGRRLGQAVGHRGDPVVQFGDRNDRRPDGIAVAQADMPRGEPQHRVGDAQTAVAEFVRPVDEAGGAQIDASALPRRAEVGLGQWSEHPPPLLRSC